MIRLPPLILLAAALVALAGDQGSRHRASPGDLGRQVRGKRKPLP